MPMVSVGYSVRAVQRSAIRSDVLKETPIPEISDHHCRFQLTWDERRIDRIFYRRIGNLPNLWKDADPGIAEVEDARERLAGLKGD